MKYPERLLSEGETIVFDIHHHPVVLWRPVLATLLFLAAWLALVVTFGFCRSGWVLLAGFLILLALVLFLGWRIMVWTHVNFVLTNHRLIYRSGVFSRHARETPLSKINDVSFCQTVPQRVFGLGDLVVESASEYGQTPYMNVPHPETLKMNILERIRFAQGDTSGEDGKGIAREVAQIIERSRPTQEITALPPERPPLYSEIVDQIERLDGMRRRGVISDEEFEKAKRGMLDRLDEEQGS